MAESSPGSAYEGVCINCGRTIRAAVFIDWHAVRPPSSVSVDCGCRYGHTGVTLDHVPGEVSTAAMRATA